MNDALANAASTLNYACPKEFVSARRNATGLISGGLTGLLVVLGVCACSQPSDGNTSQLSWGWVTNCAGPAFSKFSQNGRAGPGPDRPVFRLNDQLVVAVPKNNHPNANNLDRQPPECKSLNDLPPARYLFFGFAGTWSAGYKPEDVPWIAGARVVPDWVSARIEPEMPSTLSVPEQQKVDELLREHQRSFSEPPREIGGLTCFFPKAHSFPYINCSGSRPGDPDLVKLRYEQVGPSFVLLQADYASSRYGQIHVYWQTVTSDVSHWRDIEEELWRLLAEWNLVNSQSAKVEQR